MTAAELETGKDFGRYLDADGDGIPYRTYPGTHPTRGAFFTRGSTRDRYARYTEDGGAYVDNMERLLRKFGTAKKLVPQAIRKNAATPARYGVIYYGSTSPAMDEAIDWLSAMGHHLNMLRVRAFPFGHEVEEFAAQHDLVFVAEQNRDGQLRTLLMNECGIDPAKLVPVLHYDGSPVNARFIIGEIASRLSASKVMPFRKVGS